MSFKSEYVLSLANVDNSSFVKSSSDSITLRITTSLLSTSKVQVDLNTKTISFLLIGPNVTLDESNLPKASSDSKASLIFRIRYIKPYFIRRAPTKHIKQEPIISLAEFTASAVRLGTFCIRCFNLNWLTTE